MIDVKSGKSEDRPVDARELLCLLWRRRVLLISSTLISTALLTVLAFVVTPRYRGTAVLLPASPAGSSLGPSLGAFSGIASFAGIDIGGSDTDVDEALAVLQSERFTRAFITSRNLLPVLFDGRWDSAAGRWKRSIFKTPTLAKGFHKFDDHIRQITTSTKSPLITLSIDWKDREKAASWANEMVRDLNAEMRARAISKADASLRFLQRELQTTTDTSTRDAVSRLIEQEVKQRMFADVTQEFALRFVDRALAPDEDDPVRPRKALFVFAGFLFGAVVGAAIAFAQESGWWSRR